MSSNNFRSAFKLSFDHPVYRMGPLLQPFCQGRFDHSGNINNGNVHDGSALSLMRIWPWTSSISSPVTVTEYIKTFLGFWTLYNFLRCTKKKAIDLNLSMRLSASSHDTTLLWQKKWFLLFRGDGATFSGSSKAQLGMAHNRYPKRRKYVVRQPNLIVLLKGSSGLSNQVNVYLSLDLLYEF